MKIFIFLLLVVSVYSYSLKWNLPSPEDHNALLRVLKKRSYGCYSGCASSCNSASSYSCSNCISNNCCNNCCQNQCNVCSTAACQANLNCTQCCKESCTNITIPVTTPCPTPCPRPDTVTTSPPVVKPIVSSSNHSTSHRNTVNSQTYNRLGMSNSISIPIDIKNTNVVKNTVTSSCNSGGSGKSCDKETIVSITPSPNKPTEPAPSDGKGNVVIITVPGDQHPHLYPITNLPCYTGGCTIRRPSWRGSFCGGWHSRTHGDYLYLGSTVDYGNWGSYGTGYPNNWAGTEYSSGYPTWIGSGYPSTWTGSGISSSWTSGYPGTGTSGYPSTWTSGYPSTWGGGYPWLGTGTSSWVGSGLGQYSSPWYGYGLGGYSIPWSGFTASGLGGYTLPWTGLSTATIGSRLGLSGCSNINQDCSLCGSQFYNKFAHNSLAFGSCYGCFV